MNHKSLRRCSRRLFPVMKRPWLFQLKISVHLLDNFDAAITYYHKALWLDPNDQFCTEMLTLALEDDCRGVDQRK
ncbi:Tetratricopeptide repeat [Musa troglodytarum]|uniref:Tetratricopeptide repeat n=1 Tax=Musa troglodytarum TaxID=320322 RepID=A0A9E7HUB3_9LILI|nr:Tetratricopeptide repeat [Musa troglodytarum]